MYKLKFEENNEGIIIKTEQKTFRKLIAWIKENIIHYYPISNCKVKIERVHSSGASEIIADGNGLEILDLIKIADEGMD